MAEIEAEQALVNANRELITRLETKIQATLARIWGEAAKALGVAQEADVPPSHEATADTANPVRFHTGYAAEAHSRY